MNKAFVREPEDDGRRNCPRCGSLGDAVGAAVLDRFLMPAKRGQLGSAAHYCPSPSCELAYFDAYGRTATIANLALPVYPKHPEAPICACFGATEAEIDLDLAEGGVTRTKALLERAKSAEARCSELAANGRSCVAEVQRYYMRRRGATG